MKVPKQIAAIVLAGLLAACGDPTEIDLMKDTHIDGCDTATVGSMLISYFPSTNWTSYQGDTETTFTIYGSGEFLLNGSTRLAKLEFSYDGEANQTTLIGGTFNDLDQAMPTLTALIDNMCVDASD